MSLNDLIHRYSPDRSREEKLHILDGIAAHLPAPEFLWLGVAAAALKDEDASLRQAALHLLAQAPHGWDMVLVSALTSADESHQHACVRVLTAHAFSSEELREAFLTLGQLPGWLPAALAAWEEARQQFAPTEAEEVEAAPESVVETVERGPAPEFVALQAEHTVLLESKAELEAVLARQEEEAAARVAALEALEARHREEVASLNQTLETSQRERQVLAESVQETLHTYQKRQSRMVAACVAAAVVAVAGVPAGWALGSRAGVEAAQPEYNFEAITTPAPLPLNAAAETHAEPDPQQLKEAEETGYRRALHAIASRAADLEKQGLARPAAATWLTYARLATTPSETKLGQQKADSLLKSLKAEATPRKAAITRPRAAVPAPVVKPARPVPPRVPVPPAPPAPELAPLEDAIPEHVRSKF